MRDRSPAGQPLGSQRRFGRRAHRTTGRPDRTPARWLPIVINSAFLLGLGALTFHPPRANADPVVIRRVTACGPIGPVAERYVDRDKVCRRARKEALRSLKTGRDPDWGDIIRDSMLMASKRPRRPEDSKQHHRRAIKHKANPTPPGTSPMAGLIPPPSRTELRPRPGTPVPAASETAGRLQQRPTPSATVRIVPNDHQSWSIPWGGAIALLALMSGAFHVTRHRHAIFLSTRSLLRHAKRRARPIVRTESTTAAGHESPDAPRNALFTAGAVSITGSGAEDSVRYLAMDILSRRQGEPSELVLTRPDAWRLFGMDIGIFQEDRVPGLILTDDPEQTRAVLARKTLARRVLITYADETEDFRELLNRSQGQLNVVSLSPRAWNSTEVSANGAVTNSNDALAPGIVHLPLLSRADAFNQLMSMPTRACGDGYAA